MGVPGDAFNPRTATVTSRIEVQTSETPSKQKQNRHSNATTLSSFRAVFRIKTFFDSFRHLQLSVCGGLLDPALHQFIVSFETSFLTIEILSGDRSGALGDTVVLRQLSALLRQYGAGAYYWQIVIYYSLACQKPGLNPIPILITILTCITPSTTLATIQIRKKLVLALLVSRTPR